MDLNAIVIEETSECVIKHPTTGEPTDIVINLYGQDSKVYQKASKKNLNTILKKGTKNTNADQVEARSLDLLAACSASWANMVVDGEELECTTQNARDVYKRYAWIKEQVDEHLGDRANFLQNA